MAAADLQVDPDWPCYRTPGERHRDRWKPTIHPVKHCAAALANAWHAGWKSRSKFYVHIMNYELAMSHKLSVLTTY